MFCSTCRNQDVLKIMRISRHSKIHLRAYRYAQVLYLENVEVNIKNDIAQLASTANPTGKRRSLLPLIGDALSWLFGTVK